MNPERMQNDTGSPTWETGSRVLQLSARALSIYLDLAGRGIGSVRFCSFLPVSLRREVFC